MEDILDGFYSSSDPLIFNGKLLVLHFESNRLSNNDIYADS